MEHAGTSQGLRQDQREKPTGAWDKYRSRIHNLAQQSGCPSYTESLPGHFVNQVQVFLQVEVNGKRGCGPREQGRNDKPGGENYLKMTNTSQRQLALRQAWAWKLNGSFSPQYVGARGRSMTQEKSILWWEGPCITLSPKRVSKGREDSRGREQTPPHSTASSPEHLVSSHHLCCRILQEPHWGTLISTKGQWRNKSQCLCQDSIQPQVIEVVTTLTALCVF